MYQAVYGLCCWVGLVLILSGCNIPKDPEGTLEKVQGGTLMVGVTEHPPWVTRTGEVPGGQEVALVEALARELDADVQWQWGPADELMTALEAYQLDLVIGGLTRNTPWRKKVTLTRPYVTMPILIGVLPGSEIPKQLEGTRVFVEQGTALVALVEDHGAVPVPVEEGKSPSGPIAAPAWQIEQWGWTPTRFVLRKDRHVMALPPGENGWLKQVDAFLRAHPTDATLEAEANHDG